MTRHGVPARLDDDGSSPTASTPDPREDGWGRATVVGPSPVLAGDLLPGRGEPLPPTPDAGPAGALPPLPTAGSQWVSCPECGLSSSISINRRESQDFCSRCDYPLFWVRDTVVIDSVERDVEGSFRRLPGTAGRARRAAVECPTCDEPNPAGAEICLRCGTPMRPLPVPDLVVETHPEPEPEPLWVRPEEVVTRRGWRAWLWVPLAVVGVVVVGWVTIGILQTFV